MEPMVNQANLQQQQSMQALELPVTFAKSLNPEQLQHVEQLKNSINVRDGAAVRSLGLEEQKGINSFSDCILKDTKMKDIGDAGEQLTNFIQQIKSYNTFGKDCAKKQPWFVRWFREQKDALERLQNQYKSVSENVDIAVRSLELKKLAIDTLSYYFDGMEKANLQTYQLLSMLIFAGDQVLEEEKNKHKEMSEEVDGTDLMRLQGLGRYWDDILSFERRLYELKLTRFRSIQQGIEIGKLKCAAEQISESIQKATVEAVGIWKEQMAKALCLEVIEDGINAVNAVWDITNAMYLQNSETSKEILLQSAQVMERGSIDIETFVKANQNLIEGLTGAHSIAQKAIEDRAKGAETIMKAENDLKDVIRKVTQS